MGFLSKAGVAVARLFQRSPNPTPQPPAPESAPQSPPPPRRGTRLSEGRGEKADRPSGRYRPITQDVRRDLPQIKQEQMRDLARHHWQSNAIAKRGILNLRSFVTSEGFRVRSLASQGENRARVQRFLDRWWRKNEWDEQLSKRVETLCVEGEWFYWEGPPDAEGISELRKILPENVRHVERDRLNAERLTRVVLQHPLEFDVGQARYVKHHLDIIDECCPDGDVHYLQINALSGQTRGLSDLLVVNDWLDYLDALTFAEIERVQFQKNFSWFVKLDTDNPGDILAKREELVAEGPPLPGSVKVVGKGEEWEAKSPNLQLGDAATFTNQIMLVCFGGLIMPEHYFSSGGDVNKATSANMDTPVFAFTRDRKNLIRGFLRRAIAKAIRSGVKAGTLADIPKEELDFEVVSRDPDRSAYDLIGDMLTKLGQALSNGQERGYLSDVEAARAFRGAASGLGLGDFQSVNEESLAQAKEAARLRMEAQASQLQSIFPTAMSDSRPTDSFAESEEDEKKKLLRDLVGIARERAASAGIAHEEAAKFAADTWDDVVINLVKHGRKGGQLQQRDIEDVLDAMESNFAARFPETDLGGAINGGRRTAQRLVSGLGLEVPSGRKKVIPGAGRRPIDRSLEERVLNTTVKEPEPGADRSAGGRRRTLGREVQYSQIHWAKEDIRNEILRRVELARANGETSLEEFARGLSKDKSLVKMTAKNVARNIIHSEQRAARIAEDLLYQDIAEANPDSALEMMFVRANAKGACTKCDPLDGGTFSIADAAARKKYATPQHKGCRCAWIPVMVAEKIGPGFAAELSDELAAVKTLTPDGDASPEPDKQPPGGSDGDQLVPDKTTTPDRDGGDEGPPDNDSPESPGEGEEGEPILGRWKSAQDFHASLWKDGMTPHKAQEMRRKELADRVGERAAQHLADHWNAPRGGNPLQGGWQRTTASQQAIALKREVEGILRGMPPEDETLRTALDVSNMLIRQALPNGALLYRGVRNVSQRESLLADAMAGLETTGLEVESLSAWTSDLATAQRFAGTNGFVVSKAFTAAQIYGGMGLSPGFNRKDGQGQYSSQNEVIVSPDLVEASQTLVKVNLSDVRSPVWQNRSATEQAELLRQR